jgi:hypothetical protein
MGQTVHLLTTNSSKSGIASLSLRRQEDPKRVEVQLVAKAIIAAFKFQSNDRKRRAFSALPVESYARRVDGFSGERLRERAQGGVREQQDGARLHSRNAKLYARPELVRQNTINETERTRSRQ